MTLYNAIGYDSPIFTITGQTYPAFEELISQVGSREAEARITGPIGRACTAAGNPILTQLQLGALARAALARDASALRQVTIFATNPDGH